MRAGQQDWSLSGTSLPEAPLPEIPGLHAVEKAQRKPPLPCPVHCKGTPTGPELPGRRPAASPERAQGYAAVLRVQHQLWGISTSCSPQGAQGRRSPVTAAAYWISSKAAGTGQPGRRSCLPPCKKSQENFSSDGPDGVGRRLPGAHGNHRSGRMGAGLQGPSE